MTCTRCKEPYHQCRCDLRTQDMFGTPVSQLVHHVKVTKKPSLRALLRMAKEADREGDRHDETSLKT